MTTTANPAAPTETSTASRARTRSPLRPHSTTALAVAAVTTSAWALNPLLEAGRWALLAFLACAALAWGTAWLRTWVRSPAVPTLAGFAALTYGLTIAYLSPPRGVELLPDGDTLRRLGLLAEQTMATIQESVAPMEVTPGVEAATIGGICAVLLLVELCCFGLRAPAWSAVPLLALWAPAILLYIDVSALTFFLAALTFLLLLGLAGEGVGSDVDERRRHTGIVSAWSVTVTVLVLVATPLVLLAPGWGSNPLPFIGSGGGGALLLSNELDMRENLGRQSNEVALRYHVAPTTVGALRLRTLHEFDGETWHLDERGGQREELGPDTILWPEDVPAALLDGEETHVDVEIVGLREERLPIPVFPRVVDAPARWGYDPARDEVVGRQRTRPGERYSLRTTTTAITPELLRAAGRGTPDRVEQYLALPDTVHLTDVAERAREITADATTPYDQALLLQTFLRSPPFEYRTVVPAPVTGDAVWDFLESGQGYCVQFATAMTVMARTLGIPARMAVGFLPGSAMAGSPRTYEVRGDRAHTWPELHFDGIGWVRFEPTPAVQSGLPPAYADPFANQGGGAPEEEFPTGTAGPVPAPTTTPGQGGGLVGGIGRTFDDTPAWLLAAAGALVLALAAGIVLGVRGARRRSAARLTPESAWRRMRDRLGAAGVTWHDSATPRGAAREIRRELSRRGGVMLGEDAQRGLALLVKSLETERYSPRSADATPHELEVALTAVLDDPAFDKQRVPSR